MYCSQCGSKNEDESTFCTSCGAYIDQESYLQYLRPDPKPPKSYRNTGITLTVVILLLTAGLFGLVYLFTFDGDPFVADEYVLYGDGAVGSGIISVANDPSDLDPLDDSSTVTLTFKWYESGNYFWGIKSLDQSVLYIDEYNYISERKYEVPEGATFGEGERSMTCTLIPGHYSVSVITDFREYTGSFVVGGEIIRNYDWIYDIPEGSNDLFELEFKFQYSECVSGIEYNGLRGYIQFDQLDSVFDTFVQDGSAVTKKLESELRTLYDDNLFHLYGEDDYYYSSFILTFVQYAISYYPEDFPNEIILEKEIGSDERIYGIEEYWAFPTETLIQGAGDCEDTSFLCAALFLAAELDTALVMLPGHIMAGVHLENGISPDEYPHYPSEYSEYVISEEIEDIKTGTTKTYYGCETTLDRQYLLGYTNIMSTIEEGGIEYELTEWLPSGIHATDLKTYGFYTV